jgi:2-hydroxychromene-2-carboxylate isomerase
MSRDVDFFWDVGSPYTYLAVTQLDALEKRTGARLRYRPLLLGGLYKLVGNSMPALVANKARYMLEDLARWRADYGIPMVLPTEGTPFPLNTLLPMRAAMAADLRGQGRQVCHALFAAYWGKGQDVSNPDVLTATLSAAGLDAPALIDGAQLQEVKDALRANTDEAAARGAFGLPLFYVGEQMFFGNDRLQQLERALTLR